MRKCGQLDRHNLDAAEILHCVSTLTFRDAYVWTDGTDPYINLAWVLRLPPPECATILTSILLWLPQIFFCGLEWAVNEQQTHRTYTTRPCSVQETMMEKWNRIHRHGCPISRRRWQTSAAFICMCDLWLSLTVQPTTLRVLWVGDNCWHTATHGTHWFAHAECLCASYPNRQKSGLSCRSSERDRITSLPLINESSYLKPTHSEL